MAFLDRSFQQGHLTRQRAQNEGIVLDRYGNVIMRGNQPNESLGRMNEHLADPNLESSERMDSAEIRRRLLDPNGGGQRNLQQHEAVDTDEDGRDIDQGFIRNRSELRNLTRNIGEGAGPAQQIFGNLRMNRDSYFDDFIGHPNIRRTSTPINEERQIGFGTQNPNEIGILAEQIGRAVIGQLNCVNQNAGVNPEPNLAQHGVAILQQIQHSAIFTQRDNPVPIRAPVQQIQNPQNPAMGQQNFRRDNQQHHPPIMHAQQNAWPTAERNVQLPPQPVQHVCWQPPPFPNPTQNLPNSGMGNFDFGIVLERIPDLSGTEGSDGIKKFFKKFDFYSLNWSDAQKIRALESKLYGRAERAFQTAQNTQPFRYESIKREMLNLLDETDARNLNAFDELMQGVRRAPNESIDDLANRICALVQRAYNGLPQHLSNEYAIKFLIRAMGNPELALNLELIRSPGMTLDHFVSLAARAESTQKATQRFSKTENREKTWRPNFQQQFNQTNMVQTPRNNFNERGQQSQRFGTQPNRNSNCYNCNNPGHLARDCPQARNFRPTERSNNSFTGINQQNVPQINNQQQPTEPSGNTSNRPYQARNFLKQNCLVLQEENICRKDLIVGQLKQDLEKFFGELKKTQRKIKSRKFRRLEKLWLFKLRCLERKQRQCWTEARKFL
ncbi:hypothetical protein niasHT_019072 [Heterodera trifolii]|uniref:CCHC-type domain-containing protein n=1 Tax=Heterodera trifolii TaxID=157864 RepID=A0ABD2LBQ7_9BILA